MKHILVVDDMQAWNRLVSKYLSDSGFLVDSAFSCEEALIKTRRTRLDCILMDFHLTDGTAVSLCTAIRLESDGEHPVPTIIIISGDPQAEEKAYRDCLAQKFILKDRNILGTILDSINDAALGKPRGKEQDQK